MSNRKQDLQATMVQFFGPIYAPLFLLLKANKQMPLETLIADVCAFIDQTKKRQFEATQFDYSLFELDQRPDDIAEQDRNKENQICESLINTFIEEISPKYQDIQGNPKKTLLQTGIQDQIISLLFQLKENQLQNGERDERCYSKTEYLKKLILSIIAKCSRLPDKEIADKIIKYGGVEIAFAHSLFSGDQNFRILFGKILENCKTFKELKIYEGEDISLMKSALVRQLSLCLVSLKISEKPSKEICEKLLEDPFSHVVALHKNLTDKEKDEYYKSNFYTSKFLFSYAHKVEYKNSLEYLVKDDIGKILAEIETQLVRVTSQILNHVMTFNIYQLFKVDALRNIKKNVFKTIIQKCPNYIKAFRLVHYQKKTPQSLKENELINQRILLTKIFLEIKLPYFEFQKAETAILQKKYQQIDTLTLNQSAKYTLFKHIFEVIEPYFRKQEKMTDYRSQIQQILMEELMKTQISNQTFQKINIIVQQTLDNPAFSSTQALDLSPSDIRSYKQVILNQHFVKYKQNNRKDVEEINYLRRMQLIKEIYEDNFQEKVNVSYQKVSKFVDFVIEEGRDPTQIGKIALYLSTLTALPQKKLKLIKEAFGPDANTRRRNNVIEDDQERLKQSLTPSINQILSKLSVENQDCWFGKLLQDKFGGDKVAYIKQIVKKKAFENQASPFYENLGVSAFNLRKIKAQFSNISLQFQPLLQQFNQVISRLYGAQPQQMIPREQLEEAFKNETNIFYESYFRQNQQSNLEKMLTEKYNQDKVKLAKEFIEERAFENPESTFFEKHGYSSFVVTKIKKEFKRNEKLAEELKNKTINILQMMK